MATGVGRGRICMASFNSPTLKTPCYTQRSPDMSYMSRVIADFVQNFVAVATVVIRG